MKELFVCACRCTCVCVVFVLAYVCSRSIRSLRSLGELEPRAETEWAQHNKRQTRRHPFGWRCPAIFLFNMLKRLQHKNNKSTVVVSQLLDSAHRSVDLQSGTQTESFWLHPHTPHSQPPATQLQTPRHMTLSFALNYNQPTHTAEHKPE